MKKMFLTFCTCMLLVISSKAQKCKYDVDKKDEITGLVSRAINVMQLNKACSLLQTGDVFSLVIGVKTNGSRSEIVEIGDTLVVKLENEKILYLFAKDQVLPVSRSNTIPNRTGAYTQGPVYTTYSINYFLPKESLVELKGSPIRVCRVLFPGALDFTLDFTDKAMIRIQNGAICMDGSN